LPVNDYGQLKPLKFNVDRKNEALSGCRQLLAPIEELILIP